MLDTAKKRRLELEAGIIPIITREQAIADGWTSSQLRTIARSLERIASRGYDNFHQNEDGTWSNLPFDQVSPSECDPRVNRRNAHLLRKLARELG